jgi:hypothetical protein
MNMRPYWVTSVFLALVAGNPVAAAESEANQSGWHFGGYSSASIVFPPGKKTEAGLDELSLLVSWDNNSRWRLFSEIELEQPVTWREGESVKLRTRIDMERLYGEYSFSNLLNVRAGRFLTPIGRWNQIHAAPLVWTTIRPMATQQLFPLNIDGLMVHGALALEQLGWGENSLEYSAYVEMVRDMEEDRDEPEYERSRGARLVFNSSVDIGLSVAQFEEDISGHPRYRLLGLDFVTGRNGWEASGEIYKRFEHGDGGHGGYLQGVAPLGGAWSTLARYERLQTLDNNSHERWLVGAAWKPRENDILKIEYVTGDDTVSYSPQGFMASWAILF